MHMAVALSFEQAPPISVPLRLLLTAPLFGIAFGVFLLWHGPDLIETRGSFQALAATHLLTLGFMLQAMCGALLQVSPVAAGANVWRPRLIAWIGHLGLAAGALALTAGLACEQPSALRFAAPVLIASMAFYAVVVLAALLRTSARGPTIAALRLAVGALAVTVALGAALAGAFAWGWPVPVAQLAPVHAAWAVFGWGLVLVAGVSYLVVPMFQLTPAYPAAAALWLPRVLIAAVVALSLAQTTQAGAGLRSLLGLVLLACGALFAWITLRLQERRRRRLTDATFWFFRIAMISMLAAFAVGLVLPWVEGDARIRLELALGILLLIGFFVSVINGMLYRIVPFVIWLHLQKRMPIAPNMNQLIAAASANRQLRLYLAAAACLAGALAWPPLAWPAGALFAASFALLEWNLVQALRVYVRLSRPAQGS
ncbi:MAG: hypothetical protein Fur0039_14260 [Rhodocyclaceae bacterium]